MQNRPAAAAPQLPEPEPAVTLRRPKRNMAGEFLTAVRLSRDLHGPWVVAPDSLAGYHAFLPWTGRGYMRAGMRKVITRAFRVHRLHRLEANIQPGNEPSRRLVGALGFRLEGYSPRYLKIRGRWRDHERWAITREEWPPG